MAEKYFPFDSVKGDRTYYAADFAAFFADIIGSGVLASGKNLQVTANDSDRWTVNVSPGHAWIKGHLYKNTETLNIAVPANKMGGIVMMTRTDRIVLRLYVAERKIEIIRIEGIPENSTAPKIVRNDDYWDLSLAEIIVRPSKEGITAADIKDTRMDEDVCGVVRGPAEKKIPLAAFMKTVQAGYQSMMQENENKETGWYAESDKKITETISQAGKAADAASLAADDVNTAKKAAENVTEKTTEQAKTARELIKKAEKSIGGLEGQNVADIVRDETRHASNGEKAFLKMPFSIQTATGTSSDSRFAPSVEIRKPQLIIQMCANYPPVVPREDGKLDVYWDFLYATDESYTTTYSLGGISYDPKEQRWGCHSRTSPTNSNLVMHMNDYRLKYVVLFLPFYGQTGGDVNG
ncbi:MAG: hypothetical protein J1E06_05730 [Acutalibacter sp.]|nr:hypothetical protein [Acutalibacter sp.]